MKVRFFPVVAKVLWMSGCAAALAGGLFAQTPEPRTPEPSQTLVVPHGVGVPGNRRAAPAQDEERQRRRGEDGRAQGPSAEERLVALGVQLPQSSPPVANYLRAVSSGDLVFLAGHVARRADGTVVTGKLGADLSVEQGYAAARLSALGLLASLREEIGSLDRVVRVVKVTGMVNATPEFNQHSQVVNGCSDLLVEVFGEQGKHARAAVGMSSLPLGAAVEIEMIVEVARRRAPGARRRDRSPGSAGSEAAQQAPPAAVDKPPVDKRRSDSGA